MAIVYALVARGSVVLAEFSGATTNASAVARQILERIPGATDTHVSYSQDRYIFHVKRTDGITVLCVADDTAGSESPLLLSFISFRCLLSMISPLFSSKSTPVDVCGLILIMFKDFSWKPK